MSKHLSRTEQFEEVMSKIQDSLSKSESLRDELQKWRDNLRIFRVSRPHRQLLDKAISELEKVISNLEEAGRGTCISKDVLLEE